MRVVEGICSQCSKTIRRVSNAPMLVECDCYLYCPLCGEKMTPHTPDLTPSLYKAEKDYDPLGEGPKNEATLEALFVCLNHASPHYSTRKPMEVMLK